MMQQSPTVTTEHLAEALVRLLSHDLREPLGPVALAISSLEDDPGLDDDQRTLAQIAGAQAARVTRLIDAAVAAVRGARAPVTRAVDLLALARDSAVRYEHLGGNAAVRGDARQAAVDPELLGDALLGLLEAAGGGARVEVAVDVRDGWIEIVLTGPHAKACANALADGTPSGARAALMLGAAATARAHDGTLRADDRAVVLRVRAAA